MALTRSYPRLLLSINYDVITIYLCDDTVKYQVKRAIASLSADFDSYIQRFMDAHGLYHDGNSNADMPHMHIRFKTPIDKLLLEKILIAFKRAGVLTVAQYIDTLSAFTEQCEHAWAELKSQLVQVKVPDERTIIHFINAAKLHHLLAYLHEQLLSADYNYLRVAHVNNVKTWQGTNCLHQLEFTSSAWANIEQAFSLAMADNLKRNCSNFSENFARLSAHKLKNNYAFFAIKRKSTEINKIDSQKSKTYYLIHAADTDGFDKKYQRHFKKFKV